VPLWGTSHAEVARFPPADATIREAHLKHGLRQVEGSRGIIGPRSISRHHAPPLHSSAFLLVGSETSMVKSYSMVGTTELMNLRKMKRY